MLHFLVVDDSPPARFYLQEVLAPLGKVDVAENGYEALEKVAERLKKSSQYDAVFMDIMMPGMDGLETVKKIRKLEAAYSISEEEQAGIVMVSCLDDSTNMIRAHYESGADVYLSKPAKHQDLLEALYGLGLVETPLDKTATVSSLDELKC